MDLSVVVGSLAAEAAAAAEEEEEEEEEDESSSPSPSLLFASENSTSLTEETRRAAVELCPSREREAGDRPGFEAPAEPFLEERADAAADPAAAAADAEEGLPEPSPRSAVPPLASRMSEA